MTTQATLATLTIVVTVGGDPLTGSNAQQWTVAGATVDGSEAVILTLADAPDLWVAVREDSVCLDFLVRVLVQERLDGNAEMASSSPASPEWMPLYGAHNDDDDDDDDDARESGDYAGVRVELSQVMDHAHMLRQEVLSDRKAIFSVSTFTSCFVSPPDETENTDDVYRSPVVPTAGDWSPVEDEFGGGGGPLLDQVWGVGRWVSSRVGAVIAPDPHQAEARWQRDRTNNSPIPATAANTVEEEEEEEEDQWYQPYVDVLLKHRWYLVSMREYRCGQCESMNPLRAVLQAEMCTAMASMSSSQSAVQQQQQQQQQPPIQPADDLGLQAGSMGKEQAVRLLRAMADTTPATYMVATAHHRLVQAVDALLVDDDARTLGRKKKEREERSPATIKAMEELRSARACLYEARRVFFARRGLGHILSAAAAPDVSSPPVSHTTTVVALSSREKGKERDAVAV